MSQVIAGTAALIACMGTLVGLVALIAHDAPEHDAWEDDDG